MCVDVYVDVCVDRMLARGGGNLRGVGLTPPHPGPHLDISPPRWGGGDGDGAWEVGEEADVARLA